VKVILETKRDGLILLNGFLRRFLLLIFCDVLKRYFNCSTVYSIYALTVQTHTVYEKIIIVLFALVGKEHQENQ
jgi:hypothetical protein